MTFADWMDVASAGFGFIGSVLLLVTAFRAQTDQLIVDQADKLEGDDPLAQAGRAAGIVSQQHIVTIRRSEPILLRWGAGLLTFGFVLAAAKHFI